MQQTKKPRIHPMVVLRKEFDEWAVLFNPDTAEAVGINPMGIVIWELMNGQRSFEDITTTIQNRFAGVPDTAFNEVSAFIDTLAKQGFVGYDVVGQRT